MSLNRKWEYRRTDSNVWDPIEADDLLGLVNDPKREFQIVYREVPGTPKLYEVLALTNGYFQVMGNTQDQKFWVPVSREYATEAQAQAEADKRNRESLEAL